jgi:hypothetical protein
MEMVPKPVKAVVFLYPINAVVNSAFRHSAYVATQLLYL